MHLNPGTALPAIPLTPGKPLSATVKDSSIKILAANSARKGLILTNTSKNDISLAFGTDAIYGAGLTLPSGQIWGMRADSFTTQSLYAIAGKGEANNLSIQEFTA